MLDKNGNWIGADEDFNEDGSRKGAPPPEDEAPQEEAEAPAEPETRAPRKRRSDA